MEFSSEEDGYPDETKVLLRQVKETGQYLLQQGLSSSRSKISPSESKNNMKRPITLFYLRQLQQQARDLQVAIASGNDTCNGDIKTMTALLNLLHSQIFAAACQLGQA